MSEKEPGQSGNSSLMSLLNVQNITPELTDELHAFGMSLILLLHEAAGHRDIPDRPKTSAILPRLKHIHKPAPFERMRSLLLEGDFKLFQHLRLENEKWFNSFSARGTKPYEKALKGIHPSLDLVFPLLKAAFVSRINDEPQSIRSECN